MSKPTRAELIDLLFSDPASEAWEGDAAHALKPPPDYDTRSAKIERIRGLIEIVGAEAGDAELCYENERDDLQDLACMGKRGAILLLTAAWAAERALQKPAKRASAKGDEAPSPEQLSFGERAGEDRT